MRILVLEDERNLAGVLRKGLIEHGYAVDLEYNGEDGLALAEIEPYDLVVLDIMLPGLDGLTVCRRLREQQRTMPVLMLAARDTVDDRVGALNAGADDYLAKPFAFRELVARVRSLLRRDGPTRKPVLRAGDIEVDTVTHEVRRAGNPVELTSKEYAIFEYFMRNPNRVLTRTQIAEHVWSYDFVAMSNVVDVYVAYLRRKLGDETEPRMIRTIRGTSYQLRVPST